MNLRALLFGTERGAILAIALALLGVAVGWALSLPVEPPFPNPSAGYYLVVLLYCLPAILVGAYDGGVLSAWVAEGVPYAVLWWAVTGPDIDASAYFSVWGRLGATVQVGILAGVVLGTLGFVVGRGLRVVWDYRGTRTTGSAL